MKTLPLISIVVPSYNQAQYIEETLQSLVDQEYPNLEVIIQEAGSSDGSIEVAKDFVTRYPHIFQLFVENDDGQADAINRGLARTTGEIQAFLNSDDTYLPRILHRVATEIDPNQNRYVVMGRCLFTGENSPYVGVEHPAEYISHFEHLAIWKRGFNTIPQPSVFWHRDVLQRCGALDITEQHALDYDLFSRFSKYYDFHRIDELWSTYRMHDESKTSQRTEAEVLELSIEVSRKHWGPWFSPLRWRCEASYWLYKRNSHEHARHHARLAEQAFSEKRLLVALIESLQTLRFSPEMARERLLYGWLTGKKSWAIEKLIITKEQPSGIHEDGWIGPIYRKSISVPLDATSLVIAATHYPQSTHGKIEVKLCINDIPVASGSYEKEETFSLISDIEAYQGQDIALEIRSNSYFVPHDISGGGDKRHLSLHLLGIETLVGKAQ